MTQRVIFMKDEDVKGILNRIVESINEEDLIVESFRDPWEVYKNETFLGKNYGKKRYLVIKKDVIDEIVCVCRNDILVKVIQDLKDLSTKKRIKMRVKIEKEIT